MRRIKLNALGLRKKQLQNISHLQIDEGTDVREDMAGAEQSAKYLEGLIQTEESEVPRNRIMVGGFSQVCPQLCYQ